MKHILTLLTCLLLSVTLCAQVKLTATTDKTDLALDDELTLTVHVSGVSGNIVMPQLPSLPAFNVYSREAAQSTINGKTTLSFKYIMVPRFVGKATIGAIKFNYNGQTYQTTPMEVRIYRNTPPSGAANKTATVTTTNRPTPADSDLSQLPPLEKELATRAYAHRNQPFFMVAAVSNKQPYVNEPVTLAIRFYYSQAFYDAPYQPPTLTNLFMEDLGEAQGQQTVQGTIYRYEEKRYRITGVSAGEATVGPAEVRFRPGSSPLSMLDRFFGGAAVQPEQAVSSTPIKLNIRPLPTAGRPISFYGAVGTGYSFTSKVTPEQTQAGEAVTWTATVQGPGNLKTTSDVYFPTVEGLTSYPAAPVSNYLPNNTSRSYKVFKTVLVPAASGTYTLHALAWTYFDPYTETYKTLTSKPLTLEVSPSNQTEKQMNFSPTDTTGHGIQTIGQDIRYVQQNYGPQPSWIEKATDWKWMHVLALAWLVICLFAGSIGKKSLKKHHAYNTAKSQLKQAATYEQVADAISKYLLAKWKISTASLPLKDIVSALEAKHIPTKGCQQFTDLWKDLELARFAPSQAKADLTPLKKQALSLLNMWEDIQ